MTTYVSQETEQPVTIRCRYANRPEMGCSDPNAPAVALRGQWQGGDTDVDPHWVPVCESHDEQWDVNSGTGLPLEEHYRLPRFPLSVRVWVIEEPGATFAFYDERAALDEFKHELARMSGQAVLYTGEIPVERATRTPDGVPDDAAAEYVTQFVAPDAVASIIIESWENT